MVDQSVIIEGLNKQFKLIRSTRIRWDGAVVRSGEVFTSLAYNLMRESVSTELGGQRDELWSLKLIPRCSAACKLFLAGDPIRAAHLAAAWQIEDDFDSLRDLLRSLKECIELVEKAVHRLAALHKLKVNPTAAAIVLTSPVASPSRRKTKRGSGKKVGDGGNPLMAQYLPWSTVEEEAKALVYRLHEDVAFREGLVRALIPTTANVIVGDSGVADRGSPQRLCFLWRKAHQSVKWENLLNLVEHVREVSAV
ncbi:unnamed protein product [Taenia asiatica]|uniref:Transposase n=1 Tax=Taenia asiatica TaxID=60517 RepID=A0A0R3VW30_TAEAS|nr:unnamed protein product [Taenia asiatica]